MKQLRQVTIAALACLVIYYEVYRWIPLDRWNGQFHFPVSNNQFVPDLVIGALLLWFIWSFLKVSKVGMFCGCVLLAAWVIVHAFDWWIPYLHNLPQNAGRYSFYASRMQLLPVIGNHYPPDAGHAVLDFLLYPTWLLVLTATTNARRA